MNSQPQPAPSAATRDQQIRAALDQHWAASNANDSETEHLIYHDDAVLDYPQSGERTRGRADIQKQRSIQPNQKRFTIRRVVGSGDLWVTEFILSYDNKPSYTVSIMEFTRPEGRARNAVFRGSLFGSRLSRVLGRTHPPDLEAPEFVEVKLCGTGQRCKPTR